MRSPHHLHSVFDVAPLSGFFAVARVLASLGILGRLGDSLEAVPLEYLTRDISDIMSLSSCSTMPRTAETDASGLSLPRLGSRLENQASSRVRA